MVRPVAEPGGDTLWVLVGTYTLMLNEDTDMDPAWKL